MPDLKSVFSYLNQQPSATLFPMNDSYIVLIPKKEEPLTPHDYRPISLINGIQKIYSKIVAEKIKPFLNKLLSPTQTGFLKGRSILHGFHYAQQIIQAATAQKVQIAAFKADIFKAFDTLHWQFILDSLKARQFPQTWIRCIHNNILMGRSRVIINSVAGKMIRLKRGVRQGDPLSPYLFNLAVDFLSRWINKLSDLNFLQTPFPQCKNCLLYADDTLLLLKPTEHQIVRVKLIFDIFGQIFGLNINLQKSELSITCSTASFTQNLANIISCKSATFPIKYLGLPLSDKSLTRLDYLPLVEKVQNSLSGWRSSLLSVGGRMILTNSVLSALPQYFMAVFVLPKWVIRKIDQIRRRFLWHGHKGQQGQTRALYMVNWALATRPKQLGGLGIRDIQLANYALLLKWMWQWTDSPQGWWKQATPITSENDRPWNNPHASSFWKSLKRIQPVFDSSVIHTVGNGKRINFWQDNWTGDTLKFLYPNLYRMSNNKEISVSQSTHQGEWNIQHTLLTSVAQLEKEHLLLRLQSQQTTQQPDVITWQRHSQTFTVKSAFDFLANTPGPISTNANIWSIKAPLRVSIFAWLLINNRLTTIDNLVRRGWQLTNMCAMCKQNEETTYHLFQQCPFAQEIRRYIYDVFADTHDVPIKYCTAQSFQLLTDLSQRPRARQLEITTSFVLWRERCRRIFSDKEMQPISVVREIKAEWKMWFMDVSKGALHGQN